MGNKVMLSTRNKPIIPVRTKKYAPKFIAPFKILEALLTRTAYRLELPLQYLNIHSTFHISLFKPYQDDPTRHQYDPTRKQEPTEFKIYTTVDKKLIERIITHRISDRQVQFFVHFKNTNLIDDTWIGKNGPAITKQIIQTYKNH